MIFSAAHPSTAAKDVRVVPRTLIKIVQRELTSPEMGVLWEPLEALWAVQLQAQLVAIYKDQIFMVFLSGAVSAQVFLYIFLVLMKKETIAVRSFLEASILSVGLATTIYFLSQGL